MKLIIENLSLSKETREINNIKTFYVFSEKDITTISWTTKDGVTGERLIGDYAIGVS